MPESHLIPLVLAAAAGRRPQVRVFGTDYPTPDGTCIRDYIHVADLADAHVRGLERLMTGTVDSQALNLGTGTGLSVRAIIAAAGEVTGREIPVEEDSRRPGDPPCLVASPERAREVLEWEPAHSSAVEIIGTAWRWHQKRFSDR
jgi:UDP-glucose 4-epimerase